MSKIFFQIGTNDGNDNFRKMVINEKPDIIILVEPNRNLINEIRKNYSDIPNVYIYMNAIYYNSNETLELYIPAKNGIMGTKADNGITYATGHFSLLPMNDWGEKNDMVKILTKSITFDEICNNHNIVNIEYLQIDTEGFDSEIIKMIDFSKYTIKKLRFEKWLFPSERFTRHNQDKCTELGKNGFDNAILKLKNHNYYINDISDEDGNDIIATLNI